MTERMEDYRVPLDRGRYAILRIPERLDPDEAARLTAYIGALVAPSLSPSSEVAALPLDYQERTLSSEVADQLSESFRPLGSFNPPEVAAKVEWRRDSLGQWMQVPPLAAEAAPEGLLRKATRGWDSAGAAPERAGEA